MKRHIYTIIILILPALLVLSACTDPVFYTISQEVRSRDARIKGSPSNIVEFDDYMYVASNALFRYRGGGWQVAGSPPEKKINQVAATNNTFTCSVLPVRVTAISPCTVLSHHLPAKPKCPPQRTGKT